ncbi:hypothetical protein [Nitrospirillum sp. BR 11163]|uniref:hypothetical protein n=1 Tax=Nitrospirillum sp. BR 11163 TaxID=3104323 RepID=UPI002AFF58C9|nr:hypothetical protein [Nitrospirillum sp. BR 11163]MEA1675986.1 hypothetical protein [Nitrospirillum sp. BR 11163]
MGILNGPRINFWGGIRTNVCTANNSDTVTVGSSKLQILDLAASKVNPKYAGDTDEQLINYLRQDPGSWNYYGDYLVNLVDAQVSSQGPAGGVVEGGDLTGQPVYLLGSVDPVTKQPPVFGAVMVDLDPSGVTSTQIFVGGLQIGASTAPKLLIHHDAVCSSHSVALRIPGGPGSGAFSGTFQVTFPKSAVTQYDTSSPVIAAIMNDARATGFVLRFSMFEMAPPLSTAERLQAYEANTNPSNPSSGRVIGTLGPHYQGEPDTCPPGRLLLNKAAPGIAQGYYAEGYAIVDAASNMLSIDTVNLMMKQAFRANVKDISGPIGPNVDYGPIAVGVGSTKGSLGVTFNARPTDYYKYGGIVDVPLTEQQAQLAAALPITLTGRNGANSLDVTEESLRIYGDARNIYLDDLPGSQAVYSFIVAYLGGPLPVDMTFNLTSSSSGTIANPNYLTFPPHVAVQKGQSRLSFTVGDQGNANFGFECLTIKNGSSAYFVNFRKYQKTDFGIPKGATVTWQQAYEYALRFHYIVFPAMSLRLPLNDMGTVVATADQFLARLSPAYRHTTLCMPITRSLSPSQIQLMDCFLSNKPWAPLP